MGCWAASAMSSGLSFRWHRTITTTPSSAKQVQPPPQPAPTLTRRCHGTTTTNNNQGVVFPCISPLSTSSIHRTRRVQHFTERTRTKRTSRTSRCVEIPCVHGRVRTHARCTCTMGQRGKTRVTKHWESSMYTALHKPAHNADGVLAGDLHNASDCKFSFQQANVPVQSGTARDLNRATLTSIVEEMTRITCTRSFVTARKWHSSDRQQRRRNPPSASTTPKLGESALFVASCYQQPPTVLDQFGPMS